MGGKPSKKSPSLAVGDEEEEGVGCFFFMLLLGPRNLLYQVDNTLVFLVGDIFSALHQDHWVRPVVEEHKGGVC